MPQVEMGGQLSGIHGTTNKVKTERRKEGKDPEWDESYNNDKEQCDGEEDHLKDSSVSSTQEQEMPSKPATKTTPSSKSCDDMKDDNKGKEGMTH